MVLRGQIFKMFQLDPIKTNFLMDLYIHLRLVCYECMVTWSCMLHGNTRRLTIRRPQESQLAYPNNCPVSSDSCRVTHLYR